MSYNLKLFLNPITSYFSIVNIHFKDYKFAKNNCNCVVSYMPMKCHHAISHDGTHRSMIYHATCN